MHPTTIDAHLYRLLADLQGEFWYLLTDAHRAAVSDRLQGSGPLAALALLLGQIDCYYPDLHPLCAARMLVDQARALCTAWAAWVRPVDRRAA